MGKRILKISLTLVMLLVVVYMGVCVVAAYNLTHPTRAPLKTTPTQYGLEYEDVSFQEHR